jgi:NADH:ubiquinone oxidoreductase subunit 6 (subunit J)
VAAVAAIALARAATGHPAVATLALTPDRLAAGRVWLLASSALIVSGPAVPELAGLGLAAAVALERLGARFAAVTIVVCHVGATLLAYLVLLVATGDPDGTHNAGYDYGISAVWLGLLGALAVSCWRDARAGDRRAAAVTAASVAAGVIGVAFFPLLATVEHGLAFAIGAGLAALRAGRRSAGRSARSAASTAF